MDLINRQAAIDAIEAKEANEFGNYLEYNVAFNDGLRSAVYAIEDLPSAERKGKWIEDDDPTVKGHCSVCGWESHYYEDDVVGMPYCPNCGADMRGEEK